MTYHTYGSWIMNPVLKIPLSSFQMLVETYCMSLVDRHLHITVHPRCVGQCRQVKEPQDVIVVDEHGNRDIKQVGLEWRQEELCQLGLS